MRHIVSSIFTSLIAPLRVASGSPACRSERGVAMNRKICLSLFAVLVCLAFGFLTSCSSTSKTTPPPSGGPASITAKSGTPQSVAVKTASAPLVATVLDSSSNPVSGVVVTFTAPTSGASGSFAGGTNTATTNSNGVATAATFTTNTTLGAYTVKASVAGVSTTANFSLTNIAGPPATITATSGTPQAAALNTAFAMPLVASVADTYSNPVSGVSVTFNAPGSGASCVLASSSVTTDASGKASTTCTANATSGDYVVTASVSGVTTPASFSLKNGEPYTFYLKGVETANGLNGNTPTYYALAGIVLMDANGTVLAGQQDYNDGSGITSPQPSGDSITGGSLTVNASGQGTLTLITNNTSVGVSGTEKLGVQFVNSNHALIVQFDGTATSSGSMDLQTATSAGGGNYAFTFAGVDSSHNPVGYGGVFTVASGAITGTADVNDNGTSTPNNAFTGSLAGDGVGLGRGHVTGVNINGTALNLNYYVVGPEVVRIIDVDSTPGQSGVGGAAVGSAFGQGATGGTANTFTSASLGNSVFGLQSDPTAYHVAAVGMIVPTTTSSTAGTFSGAGEDVVGTVASSVAALGGSYTVASNGYGTFIDTTGLPAITNMGLYLTDPTLNLLDPNNVACGCGGGALLLTQDSVLAGGTGIMLPQTSTTNFSGGTAPYVFGAQEYTGSDWFDFVGLGTVATGGVLSGTGLLNDPFASAVFSVPAGEYATATFNGTATPDTTNHGRYTMPTLAINPTGTGTASNFNMVIYEASPAQLIWMDEDSTSLSLGTLQQQGSLAAMPAARRPLAKTQLTNKH